MSAALQPLRTRAGQLEPASFDAERGTLRVCFATGTRAMQRDAWTGTVFEEELVVTPEAVDMTRFEAGAVPVLDGHDRFSGTRSILGTAVRGGIERGQAWADLQLTKRPDLAGIVADIGAGVIRNVSVGYRVDRYEETPAAARTDGGTVPLRRAVRWTPFEVSFVPVPADPATGTRSAPDTYPCEIVQATTPEKEPTPMSTTTTTDRAAVDAQIRALGQRNRLPEPFVADLLQRGLTLETAGLAIAEELGQRDMNAGGHRNGSSYGHQGQPTPMQQREFMVDALTARMAGTAPKSEGARPFMGARVVDMARDMLEQAGTRTAGLSAGQIIERSLHTVSDFPRLLADSGERVLRQTYQAAPNALRRISRASTARDFRAKSLLQLGEAPTLLAVNEVGEFKSGTLAETRESYRLTTLGRILGLSRQALVNDDLDAFGSLAAAMGRAAAETEAATLVSLLVSNPTMSDSGALFNSSPITTAGGHANLATGAGSALQFSALSAARQAMRLQRGVDGRTVIAVPPAFLVVPAALETTGLQLVAQIAAAQTSNVNPFAGQLELLVEPRLDADSSTRWYLAADPAVIDTIEYSYLEGSEGPQVFTDEGFEVDGVRVKVRLDFGAGVLDWRGLYRSNGA